jgi:hypothetical protein
VKAVARSSEPEAATPAASVVATESEDAK